MALAPDEKFSTFQNGGTPTTGDIIVGLRSGINTRFNWVLPAGVDTLTGTANQVLVNGTSGVATTGAVTLTTPQDIATTSSPTFADLNLGGTIFAATSLSLSSGAATQPVLIYNGTSAQHLTRFVMSNTAADRLVTFQDASGTLAFLTDIPSGSPSALTRVNDTNITVTLGGTPATALLQAVSLTMGWTGTLAETRGGTGQSTYTLGDTLYSSATNTLSKLAGNTTAVTQYLSQTGTGAVSAAPIWATISGGDITGAALTKTDDTNVTLTLGGTPATALLRAASLTLGWTGQLGLTRGGTNASLTASNGGLVYSNATQLAILAGTATAGQIPRSGSNAAPSWSTATYPDLAGTVGNVLTSDGTNFISSAGGGGVTPLQVQQDAFNYGTDTGVADAYVVALNPVVAAVTDGLLVGFTPTNTNLTINPTLNVDGTPYDIVLPGTTTVPIGALDINAFALCSFNAGLGTFVLLTPAVQSGGVTPEQVQSFAFNYGIESGAADAYVVTLSPPIASYTAGLFIAFTPGNASTNTAPTINIDGVGPVGIQKLSPVLAGANLMPGDLSPSTVAYLMWDGLSYFILLNPCTGWIDPALALRNTLINLSEQGGSAADAYVFNYPIDYGNLGIYASGLMAIMQTSHANTGAATIEISSHPSVSLNKPTGALVAGDILANIPYLILFDGSNFTVINPSTGDGARVTSITGTTNQVIASSPTGDVTLSLPQDIATSSTPIFAGFNDINALAFLRFISVGASAANYINLFNAASSGLPLIQAEGSDTDIGLNLAAKGAGFVQLGSTSTIPVNFASGTGYQHNTQFEFADTASSPIVTFPDASGTVLMTGQAINSVPSITFSTTSGIIGTVTNDDALTGSVGEYVSSVVLVGSAVALTSGAGKSITSVSLTAGDWDVWGDFGPAGANTTVLQAINGGISTTDNTILTAAADNATVFQSGTVSFTIGASSIPYYNLTPARISIAATTSVYLVMNVTFITSTASGFGKICARRVR